MKKIILLGMAMLCAFCMSACSGRMEKTAEEVTLEDVVQVNQFDTLMEKYDSIHIKEEAVDVNGNVYNTEYWRFGMDEDGPTVDTWVSDAEQSVVINARNGILYGMSGEEKSIRVVPKEEYADRIAEMVPFLPSKEEMLVSATAREDDKEIVLETTFENNGTEGDRGVTYHLNPKTLQIKRVQIADYDKKGFKTNILAMRVTYDEKDEPDTSALEAIRSSEDGGQCKVTVIMEPRRANQELRSIKVPHGCSIAISGKKSYELYSDEACQILIPSVNTAGDEVTVYAKPVE